MIDKMDRKLPQRHPLKKYRFYIAGGIVFVFLLGYIIFLSLRPKRLKIDSENIIITEVTATRFLEYMEVEGVTQPIVTIKLNTHGSGNVEKVLVEEGEMVNQGDTIFILYNNDLLRNIADQKADWEKQLITFREQEIEMEQKSLNLKQQTLQNRYDLERLRKSYELDKEEFQMGIKSRAQLQVAEDEYNYKMESARLQQENLRHDSAVSVIRRQLLNRELDRNRNKYLRAVESCADLVVTAPISGQLSFLNISPGQRVGEGESVGEIKVLEKFKIKSSVNEFYVDRIFSGLPATIRYQDKTYPLRISKVVPEVKNRTFDINLIFTDSLPENVRLGKNFRVQIELGQPEETLVINKGNFYQTTSGQWIYKLDESGHKAYKVPINLGRQNPLQYEVTDGLLPGDKVIITGYDKFGDAQELIIN